MWAPPHPASRPDSSDAGHVQLAVHGLGERVGGEARLYLGKRYVASLDVDRSAFTSGDPSMSIPPFRNYSGGRALTVSLGLEPSASGLLGADWLRVGVGYQAYVQRQEDAVASFFADPFQPVSGDDLRRTDGVGLAVTLSTGGRRARAGTGEVRVRRTSAASRSL